MFPAPAAPATDVNQILKLRGGQLEVLQVDLVAVALREVQDGSRGSAIVLIEQENVGTVVAYKGVGPAAAASTRSDRCYRLEVSPSSPEPP